MKRQEKCVKIEFRRRKDSNFDQIISLFITINDASRHVCVNNSTTECVMTFTATA